MIGSHETARGTCETNNSFFSTNDIVSYRKEEFEGYPHNLVAVCRLLGRPAQAAFDFVNIMLDARYNDWATTVAALPSWGEDVDAQVKVYVQSVKNAADGNPNWR